MEPAGVALKEGGAAALIDVSLLGVVAEVEGGNGVRVERARPVHDVVRPAGKLVCEACRSCTSRSAIQARWNKRVMV